MNDVAVPKGAIQTVTGPISPDQIGYTLPHEHFWVRLSDIPGRFDGSHQLEDEDVFVEEIALFQAQGGSCIMDLTLPALGRNPEGLRRLSQRSGLWIVMGCGWYREPYYPAEDRIDRRQVRDLADQLVEEITNGVGDTDIKPGVIGEIGVDKTWVSPKEERVHRAAARAQCETGLPIVLHALRSAVALEQLTILEEEGVDLSRVVVLHCDSYPHLSYLLALVERSTYVSFDETIHVQAGKHVDRILNLVKELVDRGYTDRILLSHDIYKMPQMRYHGGPGFAYLAETFLPKLRDLGVSEANIKKITEDNPRRLLTIT